MDAKEFHAIVQRMIAEDAEKCAIDQMLYGRSLISITPDGIHRVPPEEWVSLAEDIVVLKPKT